MVELYILLIHMFYHIFHHFNLISPKTLLLYVHAQESIVIEFLMFSTQGGCVPDCVLSVYHAWDPHRHTHTTVRDVITPLKDMKLV